MAKKKTEAQKAATKLEKIKLILAAAIVAVETALSAQAENDNEDTAAASSAAEEAQVKAQADVDEAQVALDAAVEEEAKGDPAPYTAEQVLLCGKHGSKNVGDEITADMLPGGEDQLKALIKSGKVKDNT